MFAGPGVYPTAKMDRSRDGSSSIGMGNVSSDSKFSVLFWYLNIFVSMKIAIIGAGSIGGATAMGLATSGTSHDITVTTAHAESLRKFEGYGVTPSLDNCAAAKGAELIILAIKPWLLKGVVDQISPVLDPSTQMVASMAPGVPSSELASWLPEGMPLAYVIPNTAAEVRQSMTFIAPVSTSAEQTLALKGIFDAIGEAMVVEERRLSAGTALASCGIAYALRYIRAASEGGVELGFFAHEAERIVAQTVKGAAAILQAHGSHPEAEIDKVTTPGGLTIRGLNAMEEHGFTNAVIKGLKANSR